MLQQHGELLPLPPVTFEALLPTMPLPLPFALATIVEVVRLASAGPSGAAGEEALGAPRPCQLRPCEGTSGDDGDSGGGGGGSGVGISGLAPLLAGLVGTHRWAGARMARGGVVQLAVERIGLAPAAAGAGAPAAAAALKRSAAAPAPGEPPAKRRAATEGAPATSGSEGASGRGEGQGGGLGSGAGGGSGGGAVCSSSDVGGSGAAGVATQLPKFNPVAPLEVRARARCRPATGTSATQPYQQRRMQACQHFGAAVLLTCTALVSAYLQPAAPPSNCAAGCSRAL